VNRVALQFIQNHPSPPDRALHPVKTDWAAALARLPRMVNFKIDVTHRDPRNPLSYSVVLPEELQDRRKQVELIKRRSRSFLESYGTEERFDGDVEKLPKR
jgi:hypothetical protein